MFKVIPGISISEGNVVKTLQGDFTKLLKFNYSPVDLAKLFEDIGVEVVHLVDVDGAVQGTPVNYHVLEAIAGHTDLKVDFAGGIRTDGDINKVFEYGATYFTAGTVAVNEPKLFSSWIISYGREKIALSADALDKKIKIKGWMKKTDVDLFEHIEFYYSKGLKYIKLTDIDRDGVLVGPNFDLIKEVVERFPDISVGASGGVRSVEDIRKLRDIGAYAVIVARAIYEDKIKIEDLKEFTYDN
ncbi:MAG: 1-(5-phosphoribosyl)-5-[(5-phosphoribosylamino)methylideneamino] imidazole-4-carboxamide isomerase [Cyclobacteriaceae bacterium]|nr:1-(5-phosphoribosyl)-5-[(5-phosphoribosylamino)methylideneamino] imidazole-4-carboxamide isomerase [Cyclobacteriaceae bacterium]